MDIFIGFNNFKGVVGSGIGTAFGVLFSSLATVVVFEVVIDG